MFEKQAVSPVVATVGADGIPEASASEYLCLPSQDPKTSMVGSRIVQVNTWLLFPAFDICFNKEIKKTYILVRSLKKGGGRWK